MLIPIILAGGCGTRLWPLSREAHPKQFIPLIEGKSLFQQTVNRLHALKNCGDPLIIGNEQHRFLMAEQVRQSLLPQCSIMLEPDFKGTAPAIALGAFLALSRYKDPTLLVLPADHVVEDVKGFIETIADGQKVAEGRLVTFGVVPTHPETGYGYIQKGEKHFLGYEIKRFVEKPSQKKATQYFESKEYWWNSGMFLFSAKFFLEELKEYSPEIYHATKASFIERKQGEDFIRPNPLPFQNCPSQSIDYAVMEKTTKGVVVPLHSPWNDVGAWDTLSSLFCADDNQNVCKGDVMVEQTQNCFVYSQHRLVMTVGINNLIVIETPDAVLVLDKTKSQSLKPMVTKMRDKNRKEVVYHRRVSRPWGAFESVDEGERFQVKRITVNINQRLSLQRHYHRSEHWVVVKGTAKVTRGEEEFLVCENQSVYIPAGINHRLENVGKIPLEIIEVQSGAYLGEDDIVRLEDQYGRSFGFISINKEESKEETHGNIVTPSI